MEEDLKKEINLHTLFIDDEEEFIEVYRENLPRKISRGNWEYKFKWSFISDFEEALKKIERGKYDLVVTDLINQKEIKKETKNKEIKAGHDVIKLIRAEKFFPIIAFTSGSWPEEWRESPFIKLVDKANFINELEERLHEIIDTEILRVSWSLNNDLNRAGNSSLWGFIEENWDDLMEQNKNLPEKKDKKFSFLEGLIRKRAIIQLRLGTSSNNSISPPDDSVEGPQYYVYENKQIEWPCLGQILKPREKKNPFRLVLTPHCHLIPRNGRPKADFILTIGAISAENLTIENSTQKPLKDRELEKGLQIPVRGLRGLNGRYCFLPKFLKIPNLYLDFLRVKSLEPEEIDEDYELLAILDSPYAEAVQAAFTSFYSAVGTPDLNTENYKERIFFPEPIASKKN